jgi:methyl-accepting chemotaxis protein
MEKSVKKNNRKVLLILPNFQIKFMRFLLLVTASVCLVFYLAIFGFIQYWKNVGFSAGLEENSVFFDFLDQMRISLGYTMAITLAVTATLIMTMGLYMSHKMAGPIYNLLKYLKDIKSNGWTRPISFRANDYFTELTESFNTFMDDFKISKQGNNENK